MKKYVFIFLMILMAYAGFAQQRLEWTPYLQMTGSYYTSERLTHDGVGAGIGVSVVIDSQFVAQTDMNLLWLNGNAVSNRLALGYQKKGRWTPAILATFGLLWGSRTEVVSESGERPPSPVWVIGARLAPLKFQLKSGFVSALEFGYGFGPSGGRSLEATLLSIGITF
jgi:hypothetical protein